MAPKSKGGGAEEKAKEVLTAVLLADSFTQVRAAALNIAANCFSALHANAEADLNAQAAIQPLLPATWAAAVAVAAALHNRDCLVSQQFISCGMLFTLL
jgi:hypothetical protein